MTEKPSPARKSRTESESSGLETVGSCPSIRKDIEMVDAAGAHSDAGVEDAKPCEVAKHEQVESVDPPHGDQQAASSSQPSRKSVKFDDGPCTEEASSEAAATRRSVARQSFNIAGPGDTDSFNVGRDKRLSDRLHGVSSSSSALRTRRSRLAAFAAGGKDRLKLVARHIKQPPGPECVQSFVIWCGFTTTILLFALVFYTCISPPTYRCKVEFCKDPDSGEPSGCKKDLSCSVCHNGSIPFIHNGLGPCDMSCHSHACPSTKFQRSTPTCPELIRNCELCSEGSVLTWDSLGAYCGKKCEIDDKCEVVKVPRGATECDPDRIECERCEKGYRPSRDDEGPHCAIDCSHTINNCDHAVPGRDETSCDGAVCTQCKDGWELKTNRSCSYVCTPDQTLSGCKPGSCRNGTWCDECQSQAGFRWVGGVCYILHSAVVA